MLAFYLLNTISSYAQKNNFGLNITTNLSEVFELRPEVGLVFDKQITTYNGFETGLYYRTHNRTYDYYYENNLDIMYITDKYISIPVLYKFYSNIINFSTGISNDYYIGLST